MTAKNDKIELQPELRTGCLITEVRLLRTKSKERSSVLRFQSLEE